MSFSLELGSHAERSQEKAPHTQGRAVTGNRQMCQEAFGICKFCQVLGSHGQRAKIQATEKCGDSQGWVREVSRFSTNFIS